jgi:hypothetical protein
MRSTARPFPSAEIFSAVAGAYAVRRARSRIGPMATDPAVLTDEDYPAMPDDGRRHEILGGEVAVGLVRRAAP